MRRSIFFGIIAAVLSVAALAFVACESKNGGNSIVRYAGKVVYAGTSTPFPNLEVKVTNGDKIHCLEHTNAEGQFVLTVRIDDINGDYYVLAGDSTCLPKRVNLPGFGQEQFDLGTIEVEGPSLPVVTTAAVSSITAETATCGGNVTSDGRSSVTARGVCWAKTEYPTVNDAYTTNGTGTGEFQSQLTELEHNAIYYVRAYATNSQGTAYGEQVKFTTTEGVAVVVIDSVYNITAHTAKCRAHVVSDGGFAVTKRGICWSNRPDPTIDDNITEDGSGLGEYTATLKDLVENTTYYVRAYAINSTSLAYGEQIIVTTLDGLAVVLTDSVSVVTTTTLTAHGTVVSDCDIPVTTRGFCYATTQYPTTDDAIVSVGKGLGSYQGNIKNLQIGTTYYVRAYATNETGTTYGKQISVTTKDGLPMVSTSKTMATSTIISSGGNITSDGGYNITARGVCYSVNNSNPTIENNYTTSGIGTGSFSTIITEVNVSTTYYVRAYATNSIGTGYGDVVIVTTGTGLPTVTTATIGENVTETTAISGGQVTEDGGYTVIARGVCWSTLPYPTINDSHTTDGNGMGYFSSLITNIDLTTNTYYIRAYATNENGTVYGEQEKITPDLWNYVSLPTIEYGGYIYKLYYDLGAMNWSDATSACTTLSFNGYNDWFLPNRDELKHILSNCAISDKKRYWTSTYYGYNSFGHDHWYYCVYYCNGGFCMDEDPVSSSNNHVRPVRRYKNNSSNQD